MGCTNSVPSIDLVVKDEGDASAAGWKKYIETQLVGESGCAEAFILGLNGELWAKSAGISIKAATTVTVMTETQKKVATDINEAGDLIAFAQTGTPPASGLHINGKKYIVLRTQTGDAKKGEVPFLCYARAGKSGVCIARAKTCIIAGSYNEEDAKHPTVAGKCNDAVERLARYLLENGF